MRVLITGAAGFAGRHLAELIGQQPDAELFGLVRPGDSTADRELLPPPLRIIECDVTDAALLRSVLDSIRPAIVFHLAGLSSGALAWRSPVECFEVNVLGTLKLLEAIRHAGRGAVRCVVASSGEIYGDGTSDAAPAIESTPLRPLSPYAASKAAQDLVAGQYAAAHGLAVVRLRLFNHTGPGQRPDFAASAFARQIACIERGLQPPVLEAGNLEARRDFLDVRDVARAYWLAATDGEPGAAYNVCSGSAVAIRDLLDRLISLSAREVAVRPDPDRMRTIDVPVLVGDAGRFRDATGWTPVRALDETLRDLLDWWRGRV